MSPILALMSYPDRVLEDPGLARRLPDPFREQALARSGSRRAGFIASRMLLADTCPADEPWAILGDPPGRHGLWWSLSHTAGLAACLWSSAGPCGVDVERSDRRADALAVASRYFDPAEFRWLDTLPGAERQGAFLDLWTRKEACLKALELGIANHLAGVVFMPGQDDPVRLPAGRTGPLHCHGLDGPGWRLAAAWRDDGPLPPPRLSAFEPGAQ